MKVMKEKGALSERFHAWDWSTIHERIMADEIDDDDLEACREEVGRFLRTVSQDEAVELANATEYGLVSYVYTQDLNRGMRMIDRLETGMMGLNAGVISNAAAPFGGVKQSGIGREGSLEGIDEYLTTKYTFIPKT